MNNIGSLEAQDVKHAIDACGEDIPDGEARRSALDKKLKEMFGQSTVFTTDGLDLLEAWTGVKVRGERKSL